jgi:hypothetical protein
VRIAPPPLYDHPLDAGGIHEAHFRAATSERDGSDADRLDPRLPWQLQLELLHDAGLREHLDAGFGELLRNVGHMREIFENRKRSNSGVLLRYVSPLTKRTYRNVCCLFATWRSNITGRKIGTIAFLSWRLIWFGVT